MCVWWGFALLAFGFGLLLGAWLVAMAGRDENHH
jgi:hypothetical protein